MYAVLLPTLLALTAPSSSAPLSTRFVATSWSVDEGLPQASVTGIAQDADGLLWVSTFGGVARFDGETFTKVDGADADGRRFTAITAVGNTIYVGSERGRVFRFNGAFTDPNVTEIDLGPHKSIIRSLAATPDGRVLVAAGSAGVLEIVDDKARFVAATGADGPAYRVARAANGAVWATTDAALICVEGPCPARRRIEGFFTSLVPGVEGRLVVADRKRIARLDPQGELEPVGDGYAHALAIEPGGGRWVATDRDVFRIRGNDVLRVHLPVRRSTGARIDDTRPMMRTMFVDRDGALWIGSDDAGLFHVRDRRVTQIGRQQGLVGDSVLIALPLPDGDALISAYCHGVQRFDSETLTVTRVAGIAHDACVSAIATRGAETWVDVDGDLLKVIDGQPSRVLDGRARGFGHVLSIFFDDDTVWLGTRDAGAFQLTLDGKVRRHLLLDSTVYAFARRNGALIAGTSRGVAVIDGKPLVQRDAHVRDVVVDDDGTIWAPTYGRGLLRIASNDTVTWFDEKSGFCSNAISRAVLIDDALWINGNDGVFRIERDAPNICHMLPTGEGNGGGQLAGGRLADGRLLFPTVDGLALIDPKDIAVDRPLPAVRFDRVVVDGVDLRSATRIEPGPRELEVEVVTPSFAGEEKRAFEYRLTHASSGETSDDISSASSVRFSRLRPGDYTLEVRRRHPDGRVGPAASVSFSLVPAIHETLPVKVGGPLSAVLLVFFGVRAWVRTLRARARALQAELDERAKAEHARRERDEVYRTMFEGSPGPLLVHDEQGLVVDMNPAAQALFGTKTALDALVAPDDQRIYRDLLDGALNRGAQAAEVTMLDARGAAKTVRVDCAPFVVAGKKRVLVAATDVTAAREAEEQRRAMLEKTAVAQRLEGLGRLAGGIAHDFNNVLAALTLQTTSIDPNDPKNVQELTGDMLGALERGRALTQRFLVFGKASEKKQELIVDDVIADAEPVLRRLLRPSTKLVIERGAPGAMVQIDRSHIDHMLMSLVGNAQDAIATSGDIRITTCARASPSTEGVVILASPAGGVVEVSVVDDGCGMTPDVLSHAFEPFFTTKPKGTGAGMGLAIVHGAAMRANVGLRVVTSPGCGTTVTLSFARAHQQVAPSTFGALPQRLVRADGVNISALICDDDPSIRKMQKVALEKRGARVLEAENGKQGLALLDAEQVDLVITDFLMPEMNGVELIGALRERGLKAPILFVSGYTGDPAALESIPADVTRLQKPFSMNTLVATVAALLKQ